MSDPSLAQLTQLAAHLKDWGQDLGFQQVGITDLKLDSHEQHLQEWLDKGYAGEMSYMARHGTKRSRPRELLADTRRVISVRMNYLYQGEKIVSLLDHPQKAYISRYALGRDYHKVLRNRLKKLLLRLDTYVLEHRLAYSGSRLFTDTAPVLEKAIAEKSGLGWIGKNTLLLNRQAGSWFFLGEIYTSLKLPIDSPQTINHCGSCNACIDICPTAALVAPYQLDARLCISYLTIEYKGSIPLELRALIGNRVFGCDDCQLVCPWNKFAQFSKEQDFHPRYKLNSSDLLALFDWPEEEYLQKTQGSAIRRTGYQAWSRNIAVALGNAAPDALIIKALESRKADSPSHLLAEHLDWAITQQTLKRKQKY